LKIKITGINGYLGKAISADLIKRGHEVSGVQRKLLYGPEEQLITDIKDCNVVINLAGASILQRWSTKNKKIIYNSRIASTENLVRAINLLPTENRPQKFISASAIGIYQSGILHDENSSNFEKGFIGKVVLDWENTLKELPSSVQTNIFRIGLVLGKESKTVKNLLLPFKLGLGGRIASGKQAFPFIHEKDLVRAFVMAVEDFNESKTFNLVAPEAINNAKFTKTFANKLNRRAVLPIPAFLLKLVLGKAASLLLKSPIVHPKALLNAGFEFEYPTIEEALKEIINE
jgi:uncharacterized protein (TIGR01777 family)